MSWIYPVTGSSYVFECLKAAPMPNISSIIFPMESQKLPFSDLRVLHELEWQLARRFVFSGKASFYVFPPISYLEGTRGTENHRCGANLERVIHDWAEEDVACLLEPLRCLTNMELSKMRLFTWGLHVLPCTSCQIKHQQMSLSVCSTLWRTLDLENPWSAWTLSKGGCIYFEVYQNNDGSCHLTVSDSYFWMHKKDDRSCPHA